MENMPFDYQINSYKQQLHRFALQFTQNYEDANDLVQETFVRAIKYSNLFQDGTNLKAWLFTILRNTFINNYRRAAMRNKLMDTTDDFTNQQLLHSSSNNLGDNKMVGEDISKALKMLPPTYSVPFLKFFEGYKYHEIADELNIPIGTVKTRIYLARQILKDKLKMYNMSN